MSALGLQYPKKPSELADDLESFVYVIVYMALKWHKHDMSSVIPAGETPVELSTVNSKNIRLAQAVHNLFSESFPCADGYWGGGTTKIQIIKSSHLPLHVKPTSKGPAPLASLIKSLYALLYQHYYALDEEKLEKYTVPQLEIDDVEAKVDAEPAQEKPPPKPRYYKVARFLSRVNEDDEDEEDSAGADDDQPPSSSPAKRRRVHYDSPEQQPLPLPQEQELESPAQQDQDEEAYVPMPPPPAERQTYRRVLDTHDEILKAFSSVFLFKNGKLKDLSHTVNDKYIDQFEGLQAMIGAPPRKFTTRRERELNAFDDEFYHDSQSSRRKKPRVVSRLDFGHNVDFEMYTDL